MMNFDKNQTIECIDVLLLSALWLAVEFEIMILSNSDLSYPLIRPLIPRCPLSVQTSNLLRPDAPGFRPAD